MVRGERAEGSDEYIFAYGEDYRDAVKALYMLTGRPPIVPRFALGNWWSRYHAYTQDEYLTLMQSFQDRNIPFTVATVDMDWHWSTGLKEEFQIEEQGRDNEFYGGSSGWTGYSWNTKLFPDYKFFLQEIKERNLKVTLNLHPADGVRWWEDKYAEMANALGKDAATFEKIPFDIASPDFINAYFSVLHKPLEDDGVKFWWIDWQQGTTSNLEGLDPLWMLNHYHYLDNAKDNATPLILSRYCGIGAHRYPLGFSGDTFMTWETLEYLPYFTLTATNIGYTWWSHDIGGHFKGEKNDELYVRHLQFGVFSPINRLHCSDEKTATKEPWAYQNGTGKIAEEFLRFRHKLIPYLYTWSIKTHEEGQALIEPLYYKWKETEVYQYNREYLFGEQLIIAPVTTKRSIDGYARTRVWLPEGTWTDIFTNDKYVIEKGGSERELLRTLDSIPALICSGGILPLSADGGNFVANPENLNVFVWNGNGEFTLCEDGKEEGKKSQYCTKFINECEEENGQVIQKLTIIGEGDLSVIPKKRKIRVIFKDVSPIQKIIVKKNQIKLSCKKLYQDCAAAEFIFECGAEYELSVQAPFVDAMEAQCIRAHRVLMQVEGNTAKREELLEKVTLAQTLEEYINIVKKSDFSGDVKDRLLETVSYGYTTNEVNIE